MVLFRSNIKALEKVRRTLVAGVDHSTQLRLSTFNMAVLAIAITCIEDAVRKLKEIR